MPKPVKEQVKKNNQEVVYFAHPKWQLSPHPSELPVPGLAWFTHQSIETRPKDMPSTDSRLPETFLMTPNDLLSLLQKDQ